MSKHRIPTPGSGRITLALLAVVPAVMAYPWRTPRDYWLLGIAAAVVIVLFGWWGGLHFTTILRRRLAMIGRGNAVPASTSDTAATALIRLGAPEDDSDVLPLPLIASYLDRYGVRADKIRITSRDNASDAVTTRDLDRADRIGAGQSGCAAGPLTADPVARDRSGRGPPAGRPSEGDRLGSDYRRGRRRPAAADFQPPREVAGSAARCLGLPCRIPSSGGRRAAGDLGGDPVVFRARNVHSVGDRR